MQAFSRFSRCAKLNLFSCEEMVKIDYGLSCTETHFKERKMKTYKIFVVTALLISLPALLFAGSYSKAKTMSDSKDIVDTAVTAGSFNTLVAALQAADLVDTLRGDGPFTVFAPTDEAFAKLPDGTVEELLRPENKAKLQAILTYHVVAGKVTAEEAMKISSAKTVNGESFRVSQKSGSLMIDDATVTQADIMTSNGVIHVIDTVLMPK
jgi:uncharacterized surface protein with fasciclin (FAS1) repeats